MESRERRRDVGGEKLEQCLAILTAKTCWLVLAGWLWERKRCPELHLLQLLFLFLLKVLLSDLHHLF
jgi:hypothetical protein